MHSTLLLAALAALSAVAYSADDLYECPAGWGEFEYQCYNNISRVYLRSEADDLCHNNDAVVPSVDNALQIEYLAQMHDHHPTRSAIWINVKNPWNIWGDNQGAVSYDRWGANEPSALGDCATLEVDDNRPAQASHYMARPCNKYRDWKPQVICKRPVNKIKRIIVEVAASSNAQSVDAICKIGYGAGAPVEFTAAGGSSFAYGANASFAVPPALGAGNYHSLRLDCSSNSQDALQVVKLYVEISNCGIYVGGVNAVFDDPVTCNVNLVAGIGSCIQSMPNIAMVVA